MLKAKWTNIKSVGEWGVRVYVDEPFGELPKPGEQVIAVTQKGKESVVTLKDSVLEGETDGKYGEPTGKPFALYTLA